MLGWAGWAGLGLTGLASRRVAGWAGPEPSLRHVRQAWPAGGHAFKDKKAIFSDFLQKWTYGAGCRRTPKISRPAGEDFGPADMVGGEEKRSERLSGCCMCLFGVLDTWCPQLMDRCWELNPWINGKPPLKL